jgi:hypothetical protein
VSGEEYNTVKSALQPEISEYTRFAKITASPLPANSHNRRMPKITWNRYVPSSSGYYDRIHTLGDRPKGILKRPTERFPEEPCSVFEGLSPLKDGAWKKQASNDIPPNAKWTKIDRKLVNPESLEEANERFEAYPTSVIVLRVLTKKEIQAFANRTKEIRGLYSHS